MSIRYLHHQEINRALWDECIDAAPNGLVYGYSWYLDQMADNWDALVLDQYKAVMPLPWRKKAGIFYLYQPFLCAQLGVFGSGLSQEMMLDFLRAIPGKFRLWEFSLNQGNVFGIKEYGMYQRLNHVLKLNKPYEELAGRYRENIRRNIRRSVQLGATPSANIPLHEIMELVRLQSPDTPASDLRNFEHLHALLMSKHQVKNYGIRTADGKLLASAVFVFSHRRAYYLLVGNHPNGRTLGASHALIDAFIRDHAGQDILLDFEGSDIRNLAFFYNSFGSKEELYPAIRLNRLPWFLKWLKS